MTTEVSPPGFVVPDEKRFVRSWVQSNTRNQDLLDELLGSQELQTYTPTLGSVPGTTAPNPGDTATFNGFWFELFGLVYAWGRVVWGGANLDPGSGNNFFTMSLPVAVDPIISNQIDPVSPDGAGFCPIVGSGALRDDSAVGGNAQTCAIHLFTSTSVLFVTEAGAAHRIIANDVPFPWASGDIITFMACYRRAL